MYGVSAQGIDERMVSVHYYYYNPPASVTAIGENKNKQTKTRDIVQQLPTASLVFLLGQCGFYLCPASPIIPHKN